jgi:hypothetical protein
MKRAAFLLFLLLGVASAYAAPYSASGAVYTLRSRDSSFGADADWFSIVGATSLGTCPAAAQADGGYVVFMLRDDTKGQRMFSLVLAAKSAGTSITVKLDDTVKDTAGHCYALVVF